jgi:uncharacterized protein with HEPN domain
MKFLNPMTVFAVLKALEIVGEASKNIPSKVRQKYSEVPWREMTGMRDKLSHDYLGVDLWRVFSTCEGGSSNVANLYKPHSSGF